MCGGDGGLVAPSHIGRVSLPSIPLRPAAVGVRGFHKSVNEGFIAAVAENLKENQDTNKQTGFCVFSATIFPFTANKPQATESCQRLYGSGNRLVT